MAVFVFGESEFIKNIGLRGDKVKCKKCSEERYPFIYRTSICTHINYVPIKRDKGLDKYYTVCPICGFKDFMPTYKFTEIKDMYVPKGEQSLTYIANTVGPKRYDFVVMDNDTKEQKLIAAHVTLKYIKDGVKMRGYRTKDIILVK